MINKNHVKKRQKYDGIKKMSSSVIQAKDNEMVFESSENDDRRIGGPRRPSSRGQQKEHHRQVSKRNLVLGIMIQSFIDYSSSISKPSI